ncbi:MAG TPA: AtzG-like protein [Magnetospirillaceae bacterium]|nr:AtzG-like protein [Magnetospirillaceae bacterium]
MSEEQKDALTALAAEMLKLDVPPECREGVEANLRLLAGHARTLESWLDKPEVLDS